MHLSEFAIWASIPSLLSICLYAGVRFLHWNSTRRVNLILHDQSAAQTLFGGTTGTFADLRSTYNDVVQRYSTKDKQRVQEAIQLLVTQNPNMAVAVAMHAFQKETAPWQLLRLQIATISLSQTPPELASRLQDAISTMERGSNNTLNAACVTLILCAWYLNRVKPHSYEAANTWFYMGNAYDRVAALELKTKVFCRDAALYCYQHALEEYRAIKNVTQQVITLNLIGHMYLCTMPSNIDRIAQLQVIIDYFEQAYALEQYVRNEVKLRSIWAILFEDLGDTYFLLYQASPKEYYLQRACQLYQQLETLYTRYYPEHLNNLQKITDKIQTITQLSQQHKLKN